MLKISAIEIHDFKKIRDVEIEPGERTLILIGGKNTAGKSSILDAMTSALGGGRTLPVDPIRHGADQAEIRLDLDDDDGTVVTIRRVIKSDGKGSIEVRRDGSPIGKPQAFLDEIVGARFLDPLAFLALSPAAQRTVLLELVDADGVVATLDREREKEFATRTDVGRDLKRAQAVLDSMPRSPKIDGEIVDVVELSKRVETLQGEKYRAQETRGNLASAERTLIDATANREKLERELAIALESERESATKIVEFQADVSACRDIAEIDGELDTSRVAIANANETNKAANAAAMAVEKRRNQAATVKALEKEHMIVAGKVEKIDEKKLAFLSTAKLPVEGLGFDDNGVTYRDVPFAQASGAERLRVSLALAVASSPNLRDVWIKDASLMDEDSLAIVAADAKASGCRVWLERVGDADAGAIVIVDGEVRS